ncbi:MAG: response regulator [Phycisphaerae bacterium]
MDEEQRHLVVLVLCPTGRNASLASQTLDQAGIASRPCRDMDELVEAALSDSGPAVITPESLKLEDADRFTELLANQPSWSDLPVIVFAGSGRISPRLRRLVDRYNTTLLPRPIRIPTFITTVRAAVQDRRRQYELRDTIRKLKRRTRQLQRLALELTEAEDRERDRLAQILHDDLQQILVGANFHVGLIPHRARDTEALDEIVQQLSRLLQQAVGKSRQLSHDLSPPILRQHGLLAALPWLGERMEKMHGLRVELDTHAEAEPPSSGLQVFLFRCIQELLFNAAKHAKVDSAKVSLQRENGGTRLVVEDNGVGFDPEEILRKDEMDGFGLQSIAERADFLNGTLDIESWPDDGAKFTLIMPWTPEEEKIPPAGEWTEPSEPTAADHPCEHPSGRDLRVLLVDDHKVMRDGLRALLSEQPGVHVVAEAESGLEAIELVDKVDPDVMLIDVSMPGMNGIEATRRIKARKPHLRIIGLSMLDDSQTATKMLQAGAETYIRKSGSSDKLLEAICGSQE